MSNKLTRKPGETEAIFGDITTLLKKLCEIYDEGLTYSAVLIGTLLRTLLKDNSNTKSMLMQLNKKDSIQFLDSSTSKKEVSFWEFGDNISHITICNNPDFYGGLLKKKVLNLNSKLSLNFVPLLDANKNIRWLSFDEWYEAPVLESPTFMRMTRKDIIETVTDKDGGAHFDPTIPKNYAEFREPTSLHIKLNGKDAIFNQNPVYVSMRQIAHELLKSLTNTDPLLKLR